MELHWLGLTRYRSEVDNRAANRSILVKSEFIEFLFQFTNKIQ
jgi:hypothetical protein